MEALEEIWVLGKGVERVLEGGPPIVLREIGADPASLSARVDSKPAIACCTVPIGS